MKLRILSMVLLAAVAAAQDTAPPAPVPQPATAPDSASTQDQNAVSSDKVAAQGHSWFGGLFGLLAFGIIIFIFGNSAGFWEVPQIISWLSDPETQATILIITVFWIVFNTITSGPTEQGFLKEGGEFFGFRSPPSGGAPPAGGKH